MDQTSGADRSDKPSSVRRFSTLPAGSLPTIAAGASVYAQNVASASRTIVLADGDKVKDDTNSDDVQVVRFSDVGSCALNGGRTNAEKNVHDGYDSDVISDYIGHYGVWQFFWTLLLCLFQIPSTFQIFIFVFSGAPPNRFWCTPPEAVAADHFALDTWTKVANPCAPLNYTSLLPNVAGALADYRCDSYQFHGDSPVTVVTEWSLVCDRYHLVSVTEMSFLVGTAIGSLCSGWVSDKFGRRHTLMVLATAQAVFGTAIAYSTSLAMFMALRFTIGFVSIGVVMVSFVLCLELVSGLWRTVIGILAILPVSISYILMAGIAYAAPDWRTQQLVIAVPWFCMLLMWFKVPESPRWLLVNGRIAELCRLIEVAAKWNRIKLPSNYEKTLQQPEDEVNVSFAELFRGEFLRTSILMMIFWFTVVLQYFGITLHVNNLGGDQYMNSVYAGCLELVTTLASIFVVLKMGLKLNLLVLLLASSVGCLLVNAVPSGDHAGVMLLAKIVKAAIGAVNALIPTFTALQYPTTMRTLCGGIGNFAAGIALITVPYLWTLQEIHTHLPMTIMGAFGFLGTVACCLMKNKSVALPDSTEDETDNFKEQNHYMVRKGHQNQAFDTADECQATPNVRVRT